MQNIPRVFIDNELIIGATVALGTDTAHYLANVMRMRPNDELLVFNNGAEFHAKLIAGGKKGQLLISIQKQTPHADPSNNIILAFAPIKQSRLEEMVSMCTQMGCMRFVPVITEYTIAKHINWERIKKIAIEASEQSGRNSVPEILTPIKFIDLIKECGKNLIYADERAAHDNVDLKNNNLSTIDYGLSALFIGPEGGFSNTEFDLLDKSGAHTISLGRTILRAETAAVVGLAKIMNNE